MTPQEILIRAREACAATYPSDAEMYRSGELDGSRPMQCALRALNDLDKPIPDADEAWRPFLVATRALFSSAKGVPLNSGSRALIARIIAALPLIPEQYR